ncbi:uncharacterized protein L201_007977 [Kwoniella dendrophila CBS 6074]|uniref:Uncharacterized protein n=1 Tax=Kwoniella dendrophila CBS 6074 TaxID=1295534 RepID=A0AAX4K876_9TREE
MSTTTANVSSTTKRPASTPVEPDAYGVKRIRTEIVNDEESQMVCLPYSHFEAFTDNDAEYSLDKHHELNEEDDLKEFIKVHNPAQAWSEIKLSEILKVFHRKIHHTIQAKAKIQSQFAKIELQYAKIEIAKLKSQISKLQSTSDTLKGRQGDLEVDNADLKRRLEELKNRVKKRDHALRSLLEDKIEDLTEDEDAKIEEMVEEDKEQEEEKKVEDEDEEEDVQEEEEAEEEEEEEEADNDAKAVRS